jgi:hypothetical protein
LNDSTDAQLPNCTMAFFIQFAHTQSGRECCIFLERSKAKLSTRSVDNSNVLKDQIKLITPSLSLLRNHIAHLNIIDWDKNEINRLQLELNLNNSKLLPEISLQLAVLVDSLHHVARHLNTVDIVHCNYRHVITSLTLSVDYKRVLDAGFFAPLSTIRKPMTHILSKVINIRCQARKFSTVVMKYLSTSVVRVNKKRKYDYNSHLNRESLQTSKQMKEMFICSILGNYEHIPATSRLQASARYELYRLMHGSAFHEWFQNLVQYCGLLVINTLRDFVIFSIESDQALHQHLQKLMNLKSFKSIVVDSMQRVRSYFNQMMCIGTSSLFISLTKGMKDAYSCGSAFNDINKLLSGSHTSILKISYRRPNLHMYQFLLSMRKRCPLKAYRLVKTQIRDFSC